MTEKQILDYFDNQMEDDSNDPIGDLYDDLMEDYYDGREYACSQKAIELQLQILRQTLTDDQKAALNELISMMSNDYARTAMAAFVTGLRNGRNPRDAVKKQGDEEKAPIPYR